MGTFLTPEIYTARRKPLPEVAILLFDRGTILPSRPALPDA